MIDQGQCTFADKMHNLKALSPTAVIVVGQPSIKSWFVMGPSNITDPLPAVMVLNEDGQTLKNYNSAVLSGYERSAFDWSSVLLIMVSTLIVFISSYWATVRDRNNKRGIATTDPDVPEDGIASIDARTAALFIVIASAALMALYFLIDKLIYVLIGIFAISGTTSLTVVLAHPTRKLFPKLDQQLNCPVLGRINLLYSILLVVCTPATICWLVYRKAYFAFIMQDILGAAILIMMQRVTRMASIKIASILLVSAFLYDIFWVFLSPFFFKSSVMISVATGGNTGEMVPMLLAFPRFNDIFRGFSLIGLGDLALPGLFITFTFRFDAFSETSYSKVAMFGYAVGLILTSVAVSLMQMGQPALLYLVPCTLGLVSLIAWRKRHLASMWKGIEDDCASDMQRLLS